MEKKRFYANGKFLLSGEYLVLKGASALAVPLRSGQDMTVISGAGNPNIHWTSRENGKLWFRAEFNPVDFSILETDVSFVAERISRLFSLINDLNPGFFERNTPPIIETNLGFNREWGMGSSSSMVVNLAHWAGVDPYALYAPVFGGSGYDIAAASSNRPLIYNLYRDTRIIRQTVFLPPFSRHIYFAYSGNKKNSGEEVRRFLKKAMNYGDAIDEIGHLSLRMTQTRELEEFNDIMRRHENIIATLLNDRPVKEKYFMDFDGEMKSLGAWGGDFIMLTWTGDDDSLRQYLAEKGISVVFPFHDIVLS